MDSGVLRRVRVDPQRGSAELFGVSYLLRGGGQTPSNTALFRREGDRHAPSPNDHTLIAAGNSFNVCCTDDLQLYMSFSERT